MTSLLDQYQEAEQRAANLMNISQKKEWPELTPSGYITASAAEDEKPIFNKQRISFSPPEPITHLVVSNKILVLAMVNKVLLRIDLSSPDNPDEIYLNRHLGDKSESFDIHNIFTDPFGQHLLVSLHGKSGCETIYLSRNSRKLRSTTKIKSNLITAVGWNHYISESSSTGPILLGTSKGLLFETQINTGDDRHLFQTHVEQYWKHVLDIGKDQEMAITGIEIHRMTNNDTKYFVLVTTPNRLYQFVGQVSSNAESPCLYQIFNKYVDSPERFSEIPSHLTYSVLSIWTKKPGNNTPSSFAWMTGAGVMLGKIDCTGRAGMENVINEIKMLDLPKSKEGQFLVPLSMVLTEFHVLILFKERIKGYCILDKQLAYEDVFVESFGPPIGLTKDPGDGIIWVYQVHAVYKYKVHKEARHVWKIYLDEGKFALAKEHCQDNLANLSKVTRKEADHYFDNGKFLDSAKVYSMCDATLEEIALKFIHIDEYEALKVYLLNKMSSLGNQDKTQTSLLVLWILEIFLTTMGKMKDSNQRSSSQYVSYQSEFLKFIDFPEVKKTINLNRTAIYELISSHGDEECLIRVAKLLKDLDRVIQNYIQQNNPSAAIDMLQNQNDANLIYKFCPALMQISPKDMVNLLISKGKLLIPSEVIPALVQSNTQTNPKQALDAIRYLEFCIHKLENKDISVHNYLLSLYAQHKQESLMPYLIYQGQEPESICYNLDYALRVCSEQGLNKACVHIYTSMGLYEEAVELALKVDLELAKEKANSPMGNNELKKKLWLKIACHVVKEENDIKKAMEFLQECELLKIEDVLPFFPDFVTIDHFKDAICQSLQEYNEHIVVLKQEMDQATQSAQEINSEIQSLKSKCNYVRPEDKCTLCSFPILMRGFYVFPCGHMFHTDCLTAEIVNHLSLVKRQRLKELQLLVSTPLAKDDPAAEIRERQETEIEDLIASDCLYCGELMIRSIDVPLIEPSEYGDKRLGTDDFF